jgi:acetate---CoA ligase (ADP-forming)
MTAAPGESRRDALISMLEPRSVAIVGASDRPGSFGRRAVDEVSKSSAKPEIHFVNPRLEQIEGRPCKGSLDEIDGPIDLVLMCVPDSVLPEEMQRAAERGDRSAVCFGSAFGERERVASIAANAGMAVCGAGCMGFVNVSYGMRAIGYVEPDPIPDGPIALVSCSGSAFSALLRTHRGFGWTVAVSSGQELVTPAAAYVEYAVGIPDTRVVALLLEQMSDPHGLLRALDMAAGREVAVVALTVGGSESGRRMVEAHSGVLAGNDGAWEALFDSFGVIRVADIDEMTDTLELFSVQRRAPSRKRGGGIATVHDSGAERALIVDLASELSVPFAAISDETEGRLTAYLDPGLEPGNPLDLWGTGADTAGRFGGALLALADDPEVDAVALCVDLVFEFDDDDSYEQALYETFEKTTKPMGLLSNVHSAIDQAGASRLREAGVPVFEGSRTGLLALRHLLELRDAADRDHPPPHGVDEARRARWLNRLARGRLSQVESFDLLADYGLPGTAVLAAKDRSSAIEAAIEIGLPVVLKTDVAGVSHKSDVGGVVVGLDSVESVGIAYDDLARRLGSEVLVAGQVKGGVEIALGIFRDPGLGPLIVVGAGGVLVEVMGDRAVGLPPLDVVAAKRMIDRLAVRKLLDGVRGAPRADLESVARAVVSVSVLATELGDVIEDLDVNPLICRPEGVVALDALVVNG